MGFKPSWPEVLIRGWTLSSILCMSVVSCFKFMLKIWCNDLFIIPIPFDCEFVKLSISTEFIFIMRPKLEYTIQKLSLCDSSSFCGSSFFLIYVYISSWLSLLWNPNYQFSFLFDKCTKYECWSTLTYNRTCLCIFTYVYICTLFSYTSVSHAMGIFLLILLLLLLYIYQNNQPYIPFYSYSYVNGMNKIKTCFVFFILNLYTFFGRHGMSYAIELVWSVCTIDLPA